MHSAFLANKYTKWYYNIVTLAKSQESNRIGYLESHHIIPTFCQGPDTPENIVKLTAREHYLCHVLLVKMTTGIEHDKLLNYLRDKFNCQTSKQYQVIKLLSVFKNKLSVKQTYDISWYNKTQWSRLNRILVAQTKEFIIIPK